MSTTRLLRPLPLRPHLSLRYQHLHHRHASTTPSPPQQKQPSIFRRYHITTLSLGLGLGLVLGGIATNFIAPPPMPQVGTHEDNILIADLNKRIDEEFKVKVLRGKCLGVAKQLKGQEGGWVEIVPPITAPGADGTASGVGLLPFHDRLIDALQGAKGLGVERVFWDRDEKRLVAVVWFGGALSGWPGVTHGGLLATALAEKIALAGSLARGGDENNVNSAVKPQRLPGMGNHATLRAVEAIPDEPAQLSLDYLKPTYANKFYVIRVQDAWASGDDVRLPIQGHEYLAVLETMDGKACVKATAKFSPRSELEKVGETLKEATGGWSYEEFKKWMWPSRQEETMAGDMG